jgi:hypothetical protein
MHSHGLVTGETSVVYFTMHSSGFILGIVNRYHGYNIVSLLSGNVTEFREICYIGSPLHCLLLRAVRPEQPNRPSSFRGVLLVVVYIFSWWPAGYRYIRPIRKPAHSERLPDKVFVSLDCWHPEQLCFPFACSLSHTQIHTSGALTLGVAGAPHTRLFLRHYFLRFGGGRPLHNVQHLIFRDAT